MNDFILPTRWNFQRFIQIDRTTWDKARKYPRIMQTIYDRHGSPIRRLCHGYELSIPTVKPAKWIIHTTNGQENTRFENEMNFLLDSEEVSTHYGVGKQGQVARLLQPNRHVAWCAGHCKPGWSNANTINVECHLTWGELWTPAQFIALTNLILEGSLAYKINLLDESVIETHRAVARPEGRKNDPAEWADANFYAWRRWLCRTLWPAYHRFLGV